MNRRNVAVAVPAIVALGLMTLLTSGCSQGSKGHSVTVTWKATDQPDVVGYNLYRSTISGGPYMLIATKVTGTTYEDNMVTSGQTYVYVVTSIDKSGKESSYSEEVKATVP